MARSSRRFPAPAMAAALGAAVLGLGGCASTGVFSGSSHAHGHHGGGHRSVTIVQTGGAFGSLHSGHGRTHHRSHARRGWGWGQSDPDCGPGWSGRGGTHVGVGWSFGSEGKPHHGGRHGRGYDRGGFGGHKGHGGRHGRY